MYTRIASTILITVAALAFFMADHGSAAEKNLEAITITYGRSIDDLPLYVGMEQGFWKAEGLDVRLIRLVGEHNVIAAALHGDIDAGQLDPGGIFHAGLRNIPIKIVAWLGHAHSGTRCGLHVDKKSKIYAVKDLQGSRVAESGSITTAMILSETLKMAGLTKDDIRAVKGIKLDDAMKHEAALKSKGVDAIVA
jgi:ABC-type nitrate/sulfonate/bicarbonate transport system substrate-binding protein